MLGHEWVDDMHTIFQEFYLLGYNTMYMSEPQILQIYIFVYNCMLHVVGHLDYRLQEVT
jgi:hypothetical protein